MTNAELIAKIKADIERKKRLLSTLESEKPMSQSDYLDEEFAIYLNRHFLNRVMYDDSIDGFTTFDASDLANHFYDLGCRRTAEKYDEIEYNRQRKEESVPNDLEEAAVDIADALLSKPKDYALSAKADYWNGVHDGTIAGAKWQKEQMISALKNDGDLPIEFIDKFHEIDRTAFQNGQANMKEQIMKEAIHYVVQDDLDSHGASYDIPFIRIGIAALKPKGIGVGDKVRIIIVKED